MADAMAATQKELEQAKQAAHAAQQKKADMVTAAKVSRLPTILQHPAMQLEAGWPHDWLLHMHLKLVGRFWEAHVYSFERCIHTCRAGVQCGQHNCLVLCQSIHGCTDKACMFVGQTLLVVPAAIDMGRSMLLAMRHYALTQQYAAYAHGVWAAQQLITAVTGAGRRHCQLWLPAGAAYQGCTGQAESCQDQPGSQQEDCQGRCTEADAGKGGI